MFEAITWKNFTIAISVTAIPHSAVIAYFSSMGKDIASVLDGGELTRSKIAV